MRRFKVNDVIEADCTVGEQVISGTLYAVKKNLSGGADQTPVALYFAIRPDFIEGYRPHWRVDCFFKDHHLSPAPLETGDALVAALQEQKLCDSPLWLSVHRSKELEGKAYGEVFEFD